MLRLLLLILLVPGVVVAEGYNNPYKPTDPNQILRSLPRWFSETKEVTPYDEIKHRSLKNELLEQQIKQLRERNRQMEERNRLLEEIRDRYK